MSDRNRKCAYMMDVRHYLPIIMKDMQDYIVQLIKKKEW